MCFSLFIVVQRCLNTITESVIAYAGHAVGDGYRGKAAAKLECTKPYAGDAVGDGHGGEAFAFEESKVPYVGDTFAYDNLKYVLTK